MRLLLKKLLIVLAVTYSVYSGSVYAQSEQEKVEQAKKERVVNWYGSMNVEDAQALTGAITKKYPFLQINRFRGNNGIVLNKMASEARGGALGVDVITASSNVTTAQRVDPFARRHRIRVGFHNHSNVKPNEFATPDDFAAALRGASDMLAINLDIGHFTAAGFDALSFLDAHHERILSLHLKDRRRDQGPNVPFGTGDTPIVAVLRRLRDRRWSIPENIEYEYKGADTVDEVRRCLDYCRQALER